MSKELFFETREAEAREAHQAIRRNELPKWVQQKNDELYPGQSKASPIMLSVMEKNLIFKHGPVTKAELLKAARTKASELLQDGVTKEELYLMAHNAKIYAEELAGLVKDEVLKDMDSDSCIELWGQTMKPFSAGRWDYSHIPEWNEKKKELKNIENRAKTAAKNQEFLLADKDSGEVVMCANYKPNRATIRVEFKTK